MTPIAVYQRPRGLLPQQSAAIVAKADNYFNLGVVVAQTATGFERRAVQDFAVAGGIGYITVAIPFSGAPVGGSTFTIYPGCDRSHTTCNGRFSNLSHYRGYPYVPRPESGA